MIEEINKTDSGSSYIDSSSDDESVEHCTDYLTGPGVTDYDMNIIELPDFTPFIVHNINILKLFLMYRESRLNRKRKTEGSLSLLAKG